jgi:hypothetical protein
MPSIAVLPAGNRYGPYGELTLLAPLDLVDPSVEPAARLYEGDVYTATGPRDGDDAGQSVGVDAVMARMRAYEFYEERDDGFFPMGRLRSRYCAPLESMGQAMAAARRIVPRTDFDKATMAMDSRVLNVSTAMLPHFVKLPGLLGWGRSMACTSAMLRGLAKAVGGERKDVIACLAAEGFPNLPRRIVDRAETLSHAVGRIPVPYFEAKVDRAVGLGEFVAAVIPEDAPADVEGILSDAGIGTVIRYQDDDLQEKDDRSRAVTEAARSGAALWAPTAEPAMGGP